MELNFNPKMLAVFIAISLLFAVSHADDAVSVEKVSIKAQKNSVFVSPFIYEVAGKERKCPGKKFMMTPTKLKEMKLDIMLKAAPYRDDIWIFMPNKLPVRNIVEFKLVDKTTGKEFKEGMDYRLNIKGAVSQLKGKSDTSANKAIPTVATFSYLPDRYDSIFLDPENGSLSLVQGPVCNIDAEEYLPATPAGKIRLCNIAVTGDKIRVIPTYEKRKVITGGDLTRFYKKLKSGNSVKVVGYGDSITAIQTDRPLYEPKTKDRDRYERYLFRFSEDAVSQVEKFDFYDGVGKKTLQNRLELEAH